MIGESRRPLIIVTLALFLLMGAMTISNAERNGPVPDGSGGFLTPYDWVIESPEPGQPQNELYH